MNTEAVKNSGEQEHMQIYYILSFEALIYTFKTKSSEFVFLNLKLLIMQCHSHRNSH